jgi:hypothetical protein
VPPISDRNPGRGGLSLAWRRAYLGVLLLWRKRRPPATEVAARAESAAAQRRTLEERRLAAEEYHWAVAGGTASPDRPGA